MTTIMHDVSKIVWNVTDDSYLAQKYTIKRTYHHDLSFNGHVIGYAQGSDNGHCTELALYRTCDNEYVCERADHSQCPQDESDTRDTRDTRQVTVCQDADGMADFFGAGALAAQLYITTIRLAYDEE